MTVKKPTMIKKTPSKISKYIAGGTRTKTTKIAWHYTGSHDVKGINTINNWFNEINKGMIINGKYYYASSHFVMDLDGTIYEYVPMNRIAWTTNSANPYSIGIECATTGTDDHYSDAEYKSMVKLGAWLAQYYKLDPRKDFIRHYDVTKKVCPRYFVNHSDKWQQFKIDCYNYMKGKIQVKDIINCTNGKGKVTKVPSNSTKNETSIKQRYLRVLQDVNIHSTPDFNSSSICGKAEKGEILTIIKKIERTGTDMYYVKAGYSITASEKYVEVFEK